MASVELRSNFRNERLPQILPQNQRFEVELLSMSPSYSLIGSRDSITPSVTIQTALTPTLEKRSCRFVFFRRIHCATRGPALDFFMYSQPGRSVRAILSHVLARYIPSLTLTSGIDSIPEANLNEHSRSNQT